MSVSEDYATFVTELFRGLGPVTIKRMFGGAGVYRDGLMFALIAEESLYMRVDGTTRADYEAEGSKPFTFEMKGGRTAQMAYFALPDRLYDEPDEAVRWGARALDAARRHRTTKPAKATRVAPAKKPAKPAPSGVSARKKATRSTPSPRSRTRARPPR